MSGYRSECCGTPQSHANGGGHVLLGHSGVRLPDQASASALQRRLHPPGADGHRRAHRPGSGGQSAQPGTVDRAPGARPLPEPGCGPFPAPRPRLLRASLGIPRSSCPFFCTSSLAPAPFSMPSSSAPLSLLRPLPTPPPGRHPFPHPVLVSPPPPSSRSQPSATSTPRSSPSAQVSVWHEPPHPHSPSSQR